MATAVASREEQTPARTSAPRRTVAAAVVVALIAGLGWLAWEWRHPTELQGGGTLTVPMRLGGTLYADLVELPSYGNRHTITIHSAQARIAQAIPGSSVQVVLCRNGSVGGVRGSQTNTAARSYQLQGPPCW